MKEGVPAYVRFAKDCANAGLIAMGAYAALLLIGFYGSWMGG